MFHMISRMAVSICLSACSLYATEAVPSSKPLQEMFSESSAQISIDNTLYNYRTVAGTLVIKDDQGSDLASIFYTAYFLKGALSNERPITFCFNGGPGAGSVWLNIGGLGPKCLPGEDIAFLNPPYTLIDNPDSLLDLTDLVFVDPISTGLSSGPVGQDGKKMYGVDEDVQVMADFICLFTSKFKRWDSPKFLVGESYGGMRIAKMAYKLDDVYGLYFNGLIFISPALDLQTITLEKGNDLPYVLYLPSYAALAWYHAQNKEKLLQLTQKVENFAIKRYSVGLLEGNNIDPSSRGELVREISSFTNISESLIDEVDLRLRPERFMKELLQKKSKILGRFDGRITGISVPGNENFFYFDPSLEAIFGAMTASYTQYLLKDLQWPESKVYKALTSLGSWNWGKGNQYASSLEDLKKLMLQNPKVKIFIATGLYDLAIPYYATEYSIAHLALPENERKRIVYHRYPAGHMMYLNREIRQSLKKDMQAIWSN